MSIEKENNGLMDECLGEECPDSCCVEKQDCSFGYYTSYLVGKEPIPKIETHDEIGIRISGIDNSHFFITNCKRDDGGCKLEDKPAMCKLHPFRVSAEDPLDLSCPQAMEIVSNRENVDRALKLRNELGCYKDGEWLAGLQKVIDENR